jgi:hypothetical protein
MRPNGNEIHPRSAARREEPRIDARSLATAGIAFRPASVYNMRMNKQPSAL